MVDRSELVRRRVQDESENRHGRGRRVSRKKVDVGQRTSILDLLNLRILTGFIPPKKKPTDKL